jgi:hypothetical protein
MTNIYVMLAISQENEEARTEAGFSLRIVRGRGGTPTSVTCCPY